MVIDFSSQLKIKSGLSLAYQKRFYDALCIFAQEETYESALNQIVCLCQMEEYPFAYDLYRATKQKYGEMYAVYKDVASFLDVTEIVLKCCEPNVKLAASNSGKLRADKSLLFDINFCSDEEDENLSVDFSLVNEASAHSATVGGFYDVKSTQYLDRLVDEVERCYICGDERGAKKAAKRLLETETDYLPALETQIDIVCYTKKYKKGINLALRLAQNNEFSAQAICGAIEIVTCVDPIKYVGTLQILLEKALGLLDQLNVYDLEDYIHFASAYLKNYGMANAFAEELFSLRQHTGLQALKMCASAFLNVGNIDKAKEAAVLLKQAVPFDAYAQILLDYVASLKRADSVKMETPPRYLRHFFVPAKLGVYAQRKLVELLQAKGNKAALGSGELFYLRTVIVWERSLALTNNRKDYYETATFVRAALRTFGAEDVETFVAFAKEQLNIAMSDQCINEYLVALMFQYGYRGKVQIGLTDGSYYYLDLSEIVPLDETFVYEFAICATICKISKPQNYLNAYINIVNTVQLDRSEKISGHQVAYAMLAFCNKNFLNSTEEEFFTEEDTNLYKQVVKHGK